MGPGSWVAALVSWKLLSVAEFEAHSSLSISCLRLDFLFLLILSLLLIPYSNLYYVIILLYRFLLKSSSSFPRTNTGHK